MQLTHGARRLASVARLAISIVPHFSSSRPLLLSTVAYLPSFTFAMSDPEIDSSAYIELHTLGPGHCNTVNTLSFSPDGTHLGSGGDDCTLKIWKVVDGRLLFRVLFEAAVARILWHPVQRDTIIAACDDGRVFQLYDFTPVSAYPWT